MRSTIQSFAAALGCVILIGATSALAQDWPQWRGPNRDGKVTGFSVPEKWPAELTAKWKATVGAGDSTPALVGDKLYVSARQGSEEVTLCLNVADGKEIWKTKYEAQAVTGPASSHPGPRSSPAVAEGKVVTMGVGGVVSCLDAATGKELWRKDELPKVVPAFFAAMSPIIVDGMAIAHVGGKDKGAVIAFDLATGNAKWKWAGDGPAYASPVLLTVEGTKQVVVQTEKNVIGLAVADGKVLWQVASPVQGRASNAATPIVDGQTVIYTGQGRGTRAVKIEKQGDGFAAKEVWANDKIGTGFNTPVLKDGLLFGLSDGANFFCLNAKTGETVWNDTEAKRDRFCSIVDAGSVLLALPEKAGLLVFKPSKEKYDEVAKIKVSETPIYAHPVLAGKRIFVKDRENVTMWSLE